MDQIDDRELPDDDAAQQPASGGAETKPPESTEDDEDPEIREIAKRRYPRNLMKRQVWYDDQLRAKRYMDDVEDQVLKRLAQSEYRRDYQKQQDWYDEQLKAKHYMADVTDQEGSVPSSGGNSVVSFLSSPPVTQLLPESPGSCSIQSAW